MPIFYVLSGPDIGKTFDVRDGALFGRTSKCDVTLHGGTVSRRHARLEQHPEGWILVDLDSRNGISLEGVRKKRIELRDGTLFEIGTLEMRFRAEPQGISDSSQPLAAPRRAPGPRPKSEPGPAARAQVDIQEQDEELDLSGEIEFEDEQLFDAPAAPLPEPSPPRAPAQPGTSPAASPARKPAGTGAGGGAVDVRDGSRPALRFSNYGESRGFFSADLSQYPPWIRLVAGLLALALFATVFYFAYLSSGSLKERAAGGDQVEEESSS